MIWCSVSDYGTLKNFPSKYMPNGTDIIPIIIAVMRLAWSGIIIDKIENRNRPVPIGIK